MAKRNPFHETRLIDVFMCAAFPLAAVICGLTPDLRELVPWCLGASVLPIGGYLAGYRWV